MFYSLRHARPDSQTLLRIAKRSVLLVLIGVALNGFPFSRDLDELRLMGVLQRIGVCYGIAAILVLLVQRRYLLLVALALLVFYWLALVLGSSQPYSLEHNLVRQLDLAVLGANHLYQGFGIAFDPEGILSSVPAVSSVLLGYYAAAQLSERDVKAGAIWLVKSAALLLLGSAACAVFWPVNKALWTGSYVLLSTGLLFALLAMLVWLTEVKQQIRLIQPLVTYGTNPLFIYVLSWLWAVTLGLIPLADTTLYQYLFTLLWQLMPAKLASLLFAVLHVVLFWWLSRLLYRRNIIIRL